MFWTLVQEEGYEEICGEIEMLQECSHPNVVRYLGSYQAEEYLWVWDTLIDLDSFTLLAAPEACFFFPGTWFLRCIEL